MRRTRAPLQSNTCQYNIVVGGRAAKASSSEESELPDGHRQSARCRPRQWNRAGPASLSLSSTVPSFRVTLLSVSNRRNFCSLKPRNLRARLEGSWGCQCDCCSPKRRMNARNATALACGARIEEDFSNAFLFRLLFCMALPLRRVRCEVPGFPSPICACPSDRIPRPLTHCRSPSRWRVRLRSGLALTHRRSEFMLRRITRRNLEGSPNPVPFASSVAHKSRTRGGASRKMEAGGGIPLRRFD